MTKRPMYFGSIEYSSSRVHWVKSKYNGSFGGFVLEGLDSWRFRLLVFYGDSLVG